MFKYSWYGEWPHQRCSNHCIFTVGWKSCSNPGRLNFKAGGGKQGGWSAGKNNGNQWIQVALGSYTKLTSIATQGRNAHSQWVTAYKLQYSEDGVKFYYYKVSGQSSPKVCLLPCVTY